MLQQEEVGAHYVLPEQGRLPDEDGPPSVLSNNYSHSVHPRQGPETKEGSAAVSGIAQAGPPMQCSMHVSFL